MWSRLARELRARGHEVFTPSLTGVGERAHLGSPAVSLSTHIADCGERPGVRYLDAFVPQDGQALVDFLPQGMRERLPREDSPHFSPYVPPQPPQAAGMTDPVEIAWAQGRRGPQPLGTLSEKLKLEGRYRGPRRYVWCSGYSPSTFRPFAERLRKDPAWRYDELPTHHYPQVSMPRETAQLLETT